MSAVVQLGLHEAAVPAAHARRKRSPLVGRRVLTAEAHARITALLVPYRREVLAGLLGLGTSTLSTLLARRPTPAPATVALVESRLAAIADPVAPQAPEPTAQRTAPTASAPPAPPEPEPAPPPRVSLYLSPADVHRLRARCAIDDVAPSDFVTRLVIAALEVSR